MGLNTVSLIRNDLARGLAKSPNALLHALSYPPHGPDIKSLVYWRESINREADKNNEPRIDGSALVVLNSIHADGYRYFVQNDNSVIEYEHNWAGLKTGRLPDGTKLTSIVQCDNGIRLDGRFSIALSCNDVLHELEKSIKTLAYVMAHLPKQNDEAYLRTWKNNLWDSARLLGEPSIPENALTIMSGGVHGETKYFRCGGNDIEELKFHSLRRRRPDGLVPHVVAIFTTDFDKLTWKTQEWLKSQRKQKKLQKIADSIGVRIKALNQYISHGTFHAYDYAKIKELENYVSRVNLDMYEDYE